MLLQLQINAMLNRGWLLRPLSGEAVSLVKQDGAGIGPQPRCCSNLTCTPLKHSVKLHNPAQALLELFIT